MKILITNDDGIKAEGIKLLVELSKKYGEILVVAPSQEQSAKSHCIEIKKGINVTKVEEFEEITCYSLDSTPADCVRFATYGLKYDYDIVFSGINRGYNLGDDILYSGTVGAAMEAALCNKKALAFSTKYNDFSGAVKYFDMAMEYIINNKLLEKHNLYNINIPPKVGGVRMTRQGDTHFNTKFELEKNEYYQRGEPHFELELDKKDSDICAILENEISITPLTKDRTKYF